MDYAAYREVFEGVMDKRFYNIEWLDDLVARGVAMPIIGENAAIVIIIKTYPAGGKAVHGLVAAGDVKEIVERLIPMAEQMGRECGCIVGEIESREGWQRLLKDYTTYQVTLRKEL